ncbi:hypothetical protein BKA62DRAFT_690643 [Auriculariales sp. MPI-PUGE-AT-0066]|nr:hypothetical protein BKA62DRAFT_690643 [Auriculariales sp. MPI-PUGE-AT-0066]
MNNEFWLAAISDVSDTRASQASRKPRSRCLSQPCLPSRLPTSGFLSREASQYASTSCDTQKRRDEAEAAALSESLRSEAEQATLGRRATKPNRRMSTMTKSTPWRDPEPYEVYQAIEKKDLIYLMEVRDRSFRLLLRRTQGSTPLLHALRLGATHREVAIVLIGAFSRFVNHLEPDDFAQPHTRELLRALRTNLKLAIDYGLATEQSDLIPSFMQALVMSEGDKWVHRNVELVSIALRSGASSRPVHSAEQAVRAFATKELGKTDAMIAGFSDYVSNAALDLVILGAWSLVRESAKVDPLPTYTFARDDRTYRLFIENLHQHKVAIDGLRSRRLRWQLKSLEGVLEGRSTSLRSKLADLAGMLDDAQISP